MPYDQRSPYGYGKKTKMIKTTNWLPLFGMNFLSVMNDNFLKWLVCFVAVEWFPKENESLIISIAGIVLVLPFILFSSYAGRFSKMKSKQKIVRITKFCEMFIVIIAFAGFWFDSIYIVIFSLFLIGLQSTLLSPAKYGLIRDIGGKEGISFGTGMIEMFTFLGVLIGTFIAGSVSDIKADAIFSSHSRIITIGIIFEIIAILGWISGLLIKTTESEPMKESQESTFFITYIRSCIKWGKTTNGGNYIVLGLSTFWLIGAWIQMNLKVYCDLNYGMTNTEISFIMGYMAIAIALGCVVSGIISKKRAGLGLIPIGGIGLSIGLTLIPSLSPSPNLFIFLLVTAAFFGGLFKVPFNNWMQHNIQGRKLGDMIAYNNNINFIFILMAGVFNIIFERLFDSTVVFIIIALISWANTIVAFLNIPGVKNRFYERIGLHEKLNNNR